MIIRDNKLTFILSLLALAFLASALTVAAITPSSSCYEFSIYEAYPNYFWYFIIMSIFIGNLIMIIQSNNTIKTYLWKLGLFVKIMACTVLLFLPIIRGYFIYGRGDVLSHIGWINDLLKEGHLSPSNIYPIDHIFLSDLYLISHLPTTKLVMMIPAIFSLFFILSFYLLSKQLLLKKSEQALVLVFVSMPLFGNAHLLFAPTMQASLLLPFMLYIFLKSREERIKMRFHFLSVILIILIVPFHPLSALMFALILITLEVSQYIFRNYKLICIDSIDTSRTLSLTTIVFFSWSAYTYLLVRSLARIIRGLIGEPTITEFGTNAQYADFEAYGAFNILKHIFNVYGQSIVLTILSLSLIIALLFSKKQILSLELHQVRSCSGFVVFFVFSIIALFIPFEYGFMRFYLICMFFAILSIASLFYSQMIGVFAKPRFKFVVLSIALFACIYFSVFNLYFSPIIRLQNQQVTESEFMGMKNFFNFRYDNIPMIEFEIGQNRFYDAIYGRDASRKNIYPEGAFTRPVDHFGYNKSDNIIYTSSSYLLLNAIGKNYYKRIFPEFKNNWRFNDDDFRKLKNDIEINKIYRNGDLDVYLIDETNNK